MKYLLMIAMLAPAFAMAGGENARYDKHLFDREPLPRFNTEESLKLHMRKDIGGEQQMIRLNEMNEPTKSFGGEDTLGLLEDYAKNLSTHTKINTFDSLIEECFTVSETMVTSVTDDSLGEKMAFWKACGYFIRAALEEKQKGH